MTKQSLYGLVERLRILRKKQNEIRKFQDARRKDICRFGRLSNEQKKEVDCFYECNYGEKIPYTWHEHNKAVSGKFDVRFFPELLFIPEFEHFMNSNSAFVDVFQDKNMLHAVAGRAGVKMPESILECACGVHLSRGERRISREQAIELVSDAGPAFLKPTKGTCSGNGCRVVDFADGFDLLSGERVDAVLSGVGRDYTLQKRIKCHQAVSMLHPQSVNTFRVMTYQWKNELIVAPVIMRIGQSGNFLDNAHAGGVFIGVDSSGTLLRKAMTEFNVVYTSHPDTGIVFEGYRIDGYEKVVAAAKEMHMVLPQIGIASWDFTLDDVGDPVLIEANLAGGSIWLIQMAHGRPFFGERTEEILQWIRAMKKLKPEERYDHLFGW